MTDYSRWEEFRDEILETGGIKTVSMLRLRDLADRTKLGVHVAREIEDYLDAVGLAYVSPSLRTAQGAVSGDPGLPQHQLSKVRVYVRDSRIGRLIEALFVMEPDDEREEADRLLQQFGGAEPAEILDKIRTLVDTVPLR